MKPFDEATAPEAAGRTRTLLARFIESETSGSVALLAATLTALAWANSPWFGSYDALLHLRLGLSLGDRVFGLSLHHWVNDGLMALFFFVVGLEIKRELVLGQLSTVRGAALPVAAAVGGMVVPALVYAAVNVGGAGARGWGIPKATDIAFALGVLAILGRRAPLALRIFLTALAIADDLGAVAVISVYYTERIDPAALAAAGAAVGLLAGLGRLGVRSAVPYAALVACAWLATLASGVHATVAGIAVALLVPVRAAVHPRELATEFAEARRALGDPPPQGADSELDDAQLARLEALNDSIGRLRAPALVLEHALHPVTTWFVLPVFALFNAGVRLDGGLGAALGSPVAVGVVLGLLLGKVVGVTGASYLVLRLGWASLPDGVRLVHLAGAGLLAGIGFTMSIFVSGLAFGEGPEVVAAKVGILLASAAAAVAGLVLLRATLPKEAPRAAGAAAR